MMTAVRTLLARLGREERGAAAVEFVLILIPMIMLTLGAYNLSLMVYTVASLNYAAEDAARCLTVKKTTCTSLATVTAYGRARYKGGGVAQFTPTTPACGNQVVATVPYIFTTGLTSTPITLTARACYPQT